ncbi:hypothetical protein BpHYR1_012477 [Brachionus plicatilis]|uniref:Uncharacterized protein n=1 Tax=Brachionus plicatilis TaxID=10195 RepID=A0A3M7T467_BRAPC|nr:hypothetical protein BpHYR1_012477 [Brachionus plicatilis]
MTFRKIILPIYPNDMFVIWLDCLNHEHHKKGQRVEDQLDAVNSMSKGAVAKKNLPKEIPICQLKKKEQIIKILFKTKKIRYYLH